MLLAQRGHSCLSVSVEIVSFRDDFLCKRNRLFVVLSKQVWFAAWPRCAVSPTFLSEGRSARILPHESLLLVKGRRKVRVPPGSFRAIQEPPGSTVPKNQSCCASGWYPRQLFPRRERARNRTHVRLAHPCCSHCPGQ